MLIHRAVRLYVHLAGSCCAKLKPSLAISALSAADDWRLR